MWLGVALWGVPMVAITVMVILRPEHRSVTSLYHEAVAHWWAREPLYHGPGGMNYLPHFALLFSPFHVLPSALGNSLWRWTALAGLVCGLWQFVRREANAAKAFALVAAVVMPLSLGALRNGQANAHLGACLCLGAACLGEERYWPASLFLLLGLAIKPLGLVGIGLALAAFPPLGWRLGLGALGFAAVPFLVAPWDYAAGQHAAAWANLGYCAAVSEHRFADLNGLLRTFGFPLTGQASLAARALAGAFFFAGCRAAAQMEAPRRALFWHGAAASYLMLFNPMTEANSYVVLAPALGLWAWHTARRGSLGQAYLLGGAALSMGVLPELLRHWLGNAFALAWHPALTLLFVGFLTLELKRERGLAGAKPTAYE